MSYSYDRTKTAAGLPAFLKLAQGLETELEQKAKRFTGGKFSGAKIEPAPGGALLVRVFLDMGLQDSDFANEYQAQAEEIGRILLGPHAVIHSSSVGPTMRIWVATARVEMRPGKK